MKTLEKVKSFVKENEKSVSAVAAVVGCGIGMTVAATKAAGVIIIVGGTLIAGYYGAVLGGEMVKRVVGLVE